MAKKKFKVPQGTQFPRTRKHLNADSLFSMVRQAFEKVKDKRAANSSITLADALMSGFAVFSLKEPSLLSFDARRRDDDPNLKRVYKIDKAPCDTRLREILDPIDPGLLRPAFKKVFAQIQRGKSLEQLTFLDGHYLVSGDGTGFFYSKNLHNAKCLEKKHTVGTAYYQNFYGACLVHPDFREVIPFAPEFISKIDGVSKNDCEREASKRFLAHFRREHPHLPVIMVEDALASNGPHIRELQKHDMRFILGAKENDHGYLFLQAAEEQRKDKEAAEALNGGEFFRRENRTTNLMIQDKDDPRIRHNLFFINEVSLNKANPDLKVNLLEYWEIHLDADGNEVKEKHFSWVTDLHITKDNAYDIMRGGRARWRIENETFNTLKNQGYHLEHNYGLGKEYLSMVFVMLTMLAFLVDQTQQLCCGLYRAAMAKHTAKKRFFENIRSIFLEWEVQAMESILKAICFGLKRNPVEAAIQAT